MYIRGNIMGKELSKELKDKFTEYINVLTEINNLRHKLDVLEDYSQKLNNEIKDLNILEKSKNKEK